jgi:hypothetical protein
LTGIPFPVDSGCCTRFPTRIVSRRTEPDSDDSFRITIDPAEVDVPGLDPASDNIKNYECSGKILTKEKFAKVIDEVKPLPISLIIETNTVRFRLNSWVSEQAWDMTGRTL